MLYEYILIIKFPYQTSSS